MLLQGVQHTGAVTFMSIQAVETYAKGNSATVMGCLFTVNPSVSEEDQYSALAESVIEVLNVCEDIFSEPTGLPPGRIHDH